jgi:hypothetical protein
MYERRKKKVQQEKNIKFVVIGVAMISVLALLSRVKDSYLAVILASLSFLIRILIFDPFRYSIYDFLLKRLKNDKMVNVLFIQSIASDIFIALFSTFATVLLRLHGMESVMIMIFIISIIFFIGYFLLRNKLIRVSVNQSYFKWKKEEINSSDNIFVAVTALLMHYGIIRDSHFKPAELEEKISNVKDIQKVKHKITFDNYYIYDEEILQNLYKDGHPCVIKAVVKEGEPAYWFPIMFLDDDGGVIWNPYSDERFLTHLHKITDICSFTIIK